MAETEYYVELVHELCKNPRESEWLEFKVNNTNPKDIGKYISALSNSAALIDKTCGYVVWGIEDISHTIVGTTFNPFSTKVGNEELQNWLHIQLTPRLEFIFKRIKIDNKFVVILEIPAASKRQITRFRNEAYIRIGSYRKTLREFPEKEMKLWKILDNVTFEELPAKTNLNGDEVLELLDYSSYFHLLNLPIPHEKISILNAFINRKIVQKNDAGRYTITNMVAILFAKNIRNFPSLERKSVRIIQYQGDNKLKTIHDQFETKGYAVGFTGLIRYIMDLIPFEENFDSSVRKTVYKYPELVIRELVSNAIMHQDFFEDGSRILIELFKNRIEITNPGKPLIDVELFLNSPPKSRNEELASLMFRMGMCEEKGSGIDKVISEIELNQLPAPKIEAGDKFTRVTLFPHRKLKNLTTEDRVQACYFHACLKYAEKKYMTNSSLRKRFGIEEKNSAIISRIINDTIQQKLIKVLNKKVGNKGRQYIPSWASG